MIKLMILGRRAPGISRKAAHHHLREVHGRLVLLPPSDAGAMPADYVQNHVIDGIYPGEGPHGIERDLFTEIWFEDVAALRASTATPYYLANLKPDEPRFVDDATVVRMLVRPEVLIEGEQTAHKLFVLSGAGHANLGAALGQCAGLTALTVNHVLPPPDGSARFADVVFEGWFVSADAARDALDAVATYVLLALIAEEFTSKRLLRLYRS